MLVSGLPGSVNDGSGRPMKRARNWGNSPFHPSQYSDPLRYEEIPTNTFGSFDMSKQDRQEAPLAVPQREKNQSRTLSCRECRRLKLKCDRNFPCQSCRKRGCGDICPEGALTSGRGSRFILANTGQLHAKISQLSERVRLLENALRDHAGSEHPLLTPDLLQMKTIQEFYGTTSTSQPEPPPRDGETLHQAVNTLSLNNDGSSLYMDTNDEQRSHGPPEVPQEVLQLSATFPFPWAVDLKIRERIRDALPPRAEAQLVCKEAQGNALWQYNLDASETFLPNLLHHCYESPIQELSPRRLALLLMVLSIGSLVDLNKPLGNLYGEAYHHLARASVCEIPLMEEPDFDTLHALFFMIWYHLIFSDNKKAVGYAWNLMGFVAKLAQGLGLHREGSRVKRIPEEHEKRRFVFWELLNLDCRMSLSLGRPPSICLAHVDVKPPSFTAPGLHVPRGEMIYHEWKNKFFIDCLSPILETIVSVNTLPYQKTIELDKKVHDFPIPEILKEDYGITAGPSTRFLAMQRALVSTGRDIALLQLHRRPFMQLLNHPQQFDWSREFAPSFLATYLSTSSIITAVETLFNQEEQLSGRFLCFWFNAFSASVTLSLLLSREPSCALAPRALIDLDRVCKLFMRAAKILPFCARTLPVVERMLDKNTRGYLDWCRRNGRAYDGESNGVSNFSSSQGPHASSGNPPYLSSAFSDCHSSLKQYLQELYDNPPVLPPLPLPVLSTLGPATSSRNGITPAVPMTNLGSEFGGFQSLSYFGNTQELFNSRSLENVAPRYDFHSTMPHHHDGTGPWLPDIYSFSTVDGIGVEHRYKLASAPATPFMPSSPRVDKNEKINFEHGELTTDLEETSYMAWF
ncbi:hypothetical protein EV361DRAFT_194264 [Lentinula raphanica]|uniref:Zn(2)-C6 fungal-type domain-containing protein n=1 Tax=Lentinula raphanica TaxID=153919 RepID=A0AA38PL91_9AGAR|nr:hypothetical protein F5878DRAFT_655781 [Lentinula raphanica]KAJ3976867.1 hypothetical protein EV361DRAFT_194264 [Lentinula raphanica]